jgi:hypothetical protein
LGVADARRSRQLGSEWQRWVRRGPGCSIRYHRSQPMGWLD